MERSAGKGGFDGKNGKMQGARSKNSKVFPMMANRTAYESRGWLAVQDNLAQKQKQTRLNRAAVRAALLAKNFLLEKLACFRLPSKGQPEALTDDFPLKIFGRRQTPLFYKPRFKKEKRPCLNRAAFLRRTFRRKRVSASAFLKKAAGNSHG